MDVFRSIGIWRGPRRLGGSVHVHIGVSLNIREVVVRLIRYLGMLAKTSTRMSLRTSIFHSLLCFSHCFRHWFSKYCRGIALYKAYNYNIRMYIYSQTQGVQECSRRIMECSATERWYKQYEGHQSLVLFDLSPVVCFCCGCNKAPSRWSCCSNWIRFPNLWLQAFEVIVVTDSDSIGHRIPSKK